MAMSQYGAANASLTLFGIPLDEFGDQDPAYTIEDMEPRSVLKMGLGGTTNRIDRVNTPKRLTVNLLPGSDQVRQVIAAWKSGVDATATHRQIGTGEMVVMFDGVLENRGSISRAGKTTVSDEQLVVIFADSDET